MTVYVMKDDLKELWRYRHPGYAKAFWNDWYRRAMSSRIEPLKTFARRLRPYVAGILAHCRYPLGTNLIEGINNTIKVIKRMAYGYRDDHYFFLRIRGRLPRKSVKNQENGPAESGPQAPPRQLVNPARHLPRRRRSS